MSPQVCRIAVAGAGLIGARHAQAVSGAEGVSLRAVVDPLEAGSKLASQYGATYFRSLTQLLDTGKVDGVILATPNQVHVDNALECIDAGIPVLVEKPLAADYAGAMNILRESQSRSVPVLTGHHRRHNPLIQQALATIERGELGAITAVHSTTWFYKPDQYFNNDWRRQPGAGPIFINLVHDIDVLRYLCGEIATLYAMESTDRRHGDVEDTAVISMRFVCGALGTMSLSDTVVAPWSWELTARENPAYAATGESCYQIGGTHGALALPDPTLWQHHEQRSWWNPIRAQRMPRSYDDPLLRQVQHFAAVIQGREQPLVSAWDGAQNLRVIDAIKQSAITGQRVELTDDLTDDPGR